MRIGGEIVSKSSSEQLLHRVENLPSGMEFMKDAIKAAQDMQVNSDESGKSWTNNLRNPNKDHDRGI